MTYTFATLEVSGAVYDEVKAKFVEAGYEHAFGFGMDDERELIDMHGIALVRAQVEPTNGKERRIKEFESRLDAAREILDSMRYAAPEMLGFWLERLEKVVTVPVVK